MPVPLPLVSNTVEKVVEYFVDCRHLPFSRDDQRCCRRHWTHRERFRVPHHSRLALSLPNLAELKEGWGGGLEVVGPGAHV